MSNMIYDALRLAIKAHDGQWRKGGDHVDSPPYVTHCIDVAEALYVHGQIRAPSIQAIALLHDVIEDTAVTYAELHAQFGLYVAEGVQDLTLPERIQNTSDYSEQKHMFQMSSLDRMEPQVRLVKYADKTCNVRDLVNMPPKWKTTSIQGYATKAKEVCDRIAEMTEVPPGLLQLHTEVFAAFDHTYPQPLVK